MTDRLKTQRSRGSPPLVARATSMLLAAPLPGLSKEQVLALVTRHEAAIASQAALASAGRAAPVDVGPWERLDATLRALLADVEFFEREPDCAVLIGAFYLVFAATLAALRRGERPPGPEDPQLVAEVANQLSLVWEPPPKPGALEWLWRLDVTELNNQIAALFSEGRVFRDEREEEREWRWFGRKTAGLTSNILMPTHRSELEAVLAERLRRLDRRASPWPPVTRGVPARPGEPDLLPGLVWQLKRPAAELRELARDSSTQLRELTHAPGWRTDPKRLARILCLHGAFLCGEPVVSRRASALMAQAGRALRCWHAGFAPGPLSRPPSAVALDRLAEVLDAQGMGSATVRAFQVGYPPFEQRRDLAELCQVVRLELEVNVSGDRWADRVGLEFSRLAVLAALAEVEESAARRKS